VWCLCSFIYFIKNFIEFVPFCLLRFRVILFKNTIYLVNLGVSRVKWFISVILATREVEIGRTEVRGQSRQKAGETPSQSVRAGLGGMQLSSQLSESVNR
jgi:hypothetical protein